MIATIVILVWAVIALVFSRTLAHRIAHNTFERIWYSAIWPAILPLWVIYYLYNRHW